MNVLWGERCEKMEFDIRQIALILLKKLPIILICALLVAALSFLYTSYFITPLYTSQTALSIQASENRESNKSVTTADYNVSVELVASISELVKNDNCVRKVGEITGLDKVYTMGQLTNAVSVASKGTENFTLAVSSPDPVHSLVLANAFAEVISDATFVDGNVVVADDNDPNRGYAKKIIGAGNVKWISRATSVPMKPSEPNTARNTMLGFGIGFFIAALYLIFHEKISARIITEEDITSVLSDLPSLGMIPLVTSEREKGEKKC